MQRRPTTGATIRFPDDLRDWIEQRALKQGRTFSGWIIYTLDNVRKMAERENGKHIADKEQTNGTE